MHIEPKIIWTNLTLCMDIQLNKSNLSRRGGVCLVVWVFLPSFPQKNKDIAEVLESYKKVK